MTTQKTKEPQYQWQVSLRDQKGLTRLGLVTNQLWHDDPKHVLFLLARYKFVAKMLSGRRKVLEVGCGDAFGTRIVLQEVGEICATDFDPVFVQDVNERMDERWGFQCIIQDFTEGRVDDTFDAAYTIDVLEHVPKNREDAFLRNICSCLTPQGVLIVGTPSIQSQVHASEFSKQGHINCKDHVELRELMLRYFHTVFLFSMNDEVVHTGFYPMAHYFMAVGAGLRLEQSGASLEG